MAKYPDDFEERKFGNVTYFAITPEWWRKMDEEDRPFNAFVAIMDGHLFLGGSTTLFEQMIAARDGTIARLADSEDYARINASLGRETSGQTPILFMMQRAEESIRHLYDLLDVGNDAQIHRGACRGAAGVGQAERLAQEPPAAAVRHAGAILRPGRRDLLRHRQRLPRHRLHATE